MQDRQRRETRPGDLAAYQLGMQLYQEEQRVKVRRHRREVHVYEDHHTTIEEITEEY